MRPRRPRRPVTPEKVEQASGAQLLPMRLSVTVQGEAIPQGSMRAFMPKGWKRPVLTSDNPRMKPWRSHVAACVETARQQQGTWPTLSTGAIRLGLCCVFVRPASVSARKRPHHTVKPDASKLLRAIEDALTRVLWRDDAQITTESVCKRYAEAGESAHVRVEIEEVG